MAGDTSIDNSMLGVAPAWTIDIVLAYVRNLLCGDAFSVLASTLCWY